MSYEEYLRSEHWERLKHKTLKIWGNRCALCNSPDNIHVHHRTYERIGSEFVTDVIALCERCHKHYHGIDTPVGFDTPKNILQKWVRDG